MPADTHVESAARKRTAMGSSPVLPIMGLLALGLAWPFAADASCNQIPGAVGQFRGLRGSIDRPFAGPGDRAAIRLSARCDAGSETFAAEPDDNVITFAFKPPSGARTLLFVSQDCAAIDDQVQACGGGAVAECVAPDAPISVEGNRIEFSIPNSDAILAPDSDQRSLSGPAAVAVSRHGAPLPCGLAENECNSVTSADACIDRLFALGGTCELFPHTAFSHFTILPHDNSFRELCTTVESECTGSASEVRMTVDADGNLLLPMDWSGVLLGERVPFARQLRAASGIAAFAGSNTPIRLPGEGFLRSFSLRGGLLPAFFEPNFDPDSENTLTLFGAADASRTVLRIDRRAASRSTCEGGARDGLPCDTSTHCPEGACVANDCDPLEFPAPCTNATECSEQCGAALFDFSTRLHEGIGPIIVSRFGPGVCEEDQRPCETDADCPASRCLGYRLSTEDPILIDGLLQTDALRATVVPEGIAATDLNGDGDRLDEVLLLSDRATGASIPTGIESDSGRADGRAVTLLRDGPYRNPAVALEDDVAAFLEAEPNQWRTDHNGDGDRFDVFLRVFRRGEELTEGTLLNADGAPAVNGNGLAIANGRVYFRTAEGSNMPRRVVRISSAPDGSAARGSSNTPHLVRDGSAVAFQSDAIDLTDDPGDDLDHVYLFDLDSELRQRIRLDYGPELDPDAESSSPWFSADGRFLALVAPDNAGYSQVWMHDRDPDLDGHFDEVDETDTVLASRDAYGGEPSEGDSLHPTVDLNGAVLAFASRAWNLRLSGSDRVFLTYWRDRDTNGDFVFDEQAFQSTNLVSVRKFGEEPNLHSVLQAAPVSDNGRFTAYASYAQDITDDDTNELCLNFFPDDQSSSNCADIFLYDYVHGRTKRISLGNRGQQGNQASLTPAMSADGRYVAFFSFASNLVAGDTNGASDVFLRDVLRGTTARLSVNSDGSEADAPSYDQSLSISADSRYVAFSSTAGNLVDGDTNESCDNDLDGIATENCRDIFLHDRFTGFTERMSVAMDGGQADGPSARPVLSGDGSRLVFQSRAANLAPGDDNLLCETDFDGVADDNCSDIFFVGPDPDAEAADLTGDGEPDDTVLRVFDIATGQVRTLCPAGQVVVRGDITVFLRPEAAGPAVGCPEGPAVGRGIDLNGDGDSDDLVVHRWVGEGQPENLGMAASFVAASETWIAALVPQELQSRGPIFGRKNGPLQTVAIHPTEAAAGDWRELGELAEELSVVGSRVAFDSPEILISVRDRTLRTGDITGNGEHSDTTGESLPRLYDAERDVLLPAFLSTLRNTPLSSAASVLGDNLLAFASEELAQPNGSEDHPDCDLNGDTDCRDQVLFVYDIERDILHNTGQAVTPCPIEVCEPGLPFVVLDHSVRFLTLESEQRQDLDGDGSIDDLVVQTFNARVAALDPVGAPVSHRAIRSGLGQRSALHIVGTLESGTCTTNGAACLTSENCPDDGECYVPPGECIEPTGGSCSPAAPRNECGTDSFCLPDGEDGIGACHRKLGPCSSDAECPSAARCTNRGVASQRSINPLAMTSDGSVLFTSAGECVRDLDVGCQPGRDEECPNGSSCLARAQDPTSGTCTRIVGSCRLDGDCPTGSTCSKDLIVAFAGDADGDEVLDDFDNCPFVANPDQDDSDADLVGDACPPGSSVVLPTPMATATDTATPRATFTPIGPTDTPQPSSPTLTATRQPTTATSSPTGAPTSESDDGCQTGPSGGAGAYTWLGPLVLLWAMRRRSGTVTLPLAAALLLAAPPSARAQACVGDCDDSGRVTVDELVTGTRIALDSIAPERCTQLDENQSKQVEIDELISAVGFALDGCPVVFAPAAIEVVLPTIRAMESSAAVLLDSLQFFNRTAPTSAVVHGFPGGGAGDCPRGGTDERSCEILDGTLVRIPYQLNDCAFGSDGGDLISINGSTALIGFGSCPGLFLPAAARFEMDQSIVVRDGEPPHPLRSETEVQIGGIIESLRLAVVTCPLSRSVLRFSGSLDFFENQDAYGIDTDAARLDARFGGLLCGPSRAVLEINGPTRVVVGDNEIEIDAEGFLLDTRFGSGETTLEGTLQSSAAPPFSVATIQPLLVEEGCPKQGELLLTSDGDGVTARFREDRTVDLDVDGDGTPDANLPVCSGGNDASQR